MTKFRFVLVLLCLGLLGALPFILSTPKPEPAGDARLAMLEVPRSSDDYALREVIHLPVRQALMMASEGNYAQALILVESLSALPGQTRWERQTIDHVRASLLDQVRKSQPLNR
jgi:hypothetical protein